MPTARAKTKTEAGCPDSAKNQHRSAARSLFDLLLELGWIRFELAFAVVAAESHFLAVVGGGHSFLGWLATDWAVFVGRSREGKAGGGDGEGDGGEDCLHDV